MWLMGRPHLDYVEQEWESLVVRKFPHFLDENWRMLSLVFYDHQMGVKGKFTFF